jgi:hypothetical protein
MNQNNRQDVSLKKKKRLKEKINGNYQPGQWLRLSRWNRLGYLITVFIFTVVLTFLSPAWLPIGQSVAYSPLAKETNERLILAQEETQQLQEPEVQPEESATEPEVQSEEELPFEEAKKSLEEEIDERYEEWESQKTSSEIFHSISAIATILMTVVITLLGIGLFELPYKRLIILVLGIITVLIQLNINIFLLEKSLAGYEILAEQGLTLKSKLESVNTDEELTEVREQFQELNLESITIE